MYALGEIILVVIGILIALQLNNWNVRKTNLKESKQFMVRLQNEVKSNIRFASNEIARKESEINSSLSILRMFHEDPETLSSKKLDSLVFICLGLTNMDFKVGTLNEGLNTGKVALIDSDSLKNLIYGLPALMERTRRQETYNNTDLDVSFVPFVYKNLSLRKIDAENSSYREGLGKSKFESFNNLDVLNSMEFENLIDNRYYNANDQQKSYEMVKSRLEQLDGMIERYIND